MIASPRDDGRTGGENAPVKIAGAGPAGLAAAITLARAGRKVEVHEAHDRVGFRFGHDLQGLENWSTPGNVLDALRAQGLSTDFDRMPAHQGMAFDARGRGYRLRSEQPFFYLLVRGHEAGSLDDALLRQALSLGVDVRFNSRLKHLDGPGILATGPGRAEVIAVGYHFRTDMDDGYWVICDDTLAPKGYAYLLVMHGHATLKTCMFRGFNRQKEYLRRTVAAFHRLVDLRMQDPVFHGGAGHFGLPGCWLVGRHPVTGEQAGIQDFLWGFGIRSAIDSGMLAANCLLTGEDYAERSRSMFLPRMRASAVNRRLFSLLGNRGYGYYLRYASSRADTREFLRRQYRPSRFKRLLWPLLARREGHGANPCNAPDCTCVWCRCG